MFKWLKNVFSSEPAEIDAATKSSVAEAVDKTVKQAQAKATPGKKQRPSVSKRKKSDGVTPTDNTPKPSARVQALKSADAVKSGPAATAVPNKTALLKMTKDKIEATGREYGVELDRRMTKANMVADFQAKMKAAAKAAIK